MNQSSLLLAEIETGLKQGQFSLAYQPIVDTNSLQVRGAEALLRWNHPKFGRLLPGSFLDMDQLGEGDALWNLTRFVIDTVCADLAEQEANPGEAPPSFVSCNIAPMLLASEALAKWIRLCCARHDISPNRLVMEVLENEISVPLSCLNEALFAIKDQGTRIALNDFGTGYSSLSRLASLKIDIVKLPQKLIRDAHTSPQDSIVAASIIQLLRKLEINVIAKGVEHADQLQWLRQHQVSFVQGFHLSKPLPSLAEALRWQCAPAGSLGNKAMRRDTANMH